MSGVQERRWSDRCSLRPVGVKLLELHPASWAHDLVEGRLVTDDSQATIFPPSHGLCR